MLQSNFTPVRTSALSNQHRALAIHQEVVIDDPQELQAVSRNQICSFLHYLFRLDRIPFPPVDTVVGAVAAVIRTRETRRVHCPTASAYALVGVEIREFIRLRRQFIDGSQRTAGIENESAVGFIAHSQNALSDSPAAIRSTTSSNASSPCPLRRCRCTGRERLVGEQRRMPPAQDDGLIRIELFGVARDLHGLADHRAGDQRDR